jgi:3-oxoadipate enol-lactonase
MTSVPDPQHFITVNGINLCYEDHGAGEVPIIFIHGFPFDKSAWQPQIEFLKGEYRVIAFDVRGFGKSASNNETASIDLFASDLLGLMDALDIKKAIVCGLSMGGYIVMNAVSRFPERFEAVILSDTQCIADSMEIREKRYKAIRKIESEGLDGYAEEFVKSVFCKETLETKQVLVEEMKNLILSTSPQSITSTLHALAQRRESCSMLKHLSVPALILCGKEDSITTTSQAEFLYNTIPNSRMHTIDKAGHLSNLEQPDTFNDHIHNFIPGIIS